MSIITKREIEQEQGVGVQEGPKRATKKKKTREIAITISDSKIGNKNPTKTYQQA